MANFYVSSSYNGSVSNGELATPFKTIQQVRNSMSLFKPGDVISFKCGDVFNGKLDITCVGTPLAYITFNSYGTGEKPIFQNVGFTTFMVGAYNNITDVYINIDGLNFTDLTFPINNKVNKAPCEQGIRIGWIGEKLKNFVNVRNCKFSNIGGGIVLTGNNCIIEDNELSNFKNIINTPNTGGNTAYEDYGGNPFTICGSNNIIRRNKISGGWAESLDFNWNGGAFEFFGNCSNNKIIQNTIVDCGGIAEFGALDSTVLCDNNLIAYNKIINCGNLSWVNFNGPFTMVAKNIKYYNNVIIENNLSRFTGPNLGAGIVTQSILNNIYAETSLLPHSSGAPAGITVYDVQNNIFVQLTGTKIFNSTSIVRSIHKNNIYKFSTGNLGGGTLDPTERIITTQIFKDESNPNPEFWDFTPLDIIPSVNTGANLGLTEDFKGNPIIGVPDIGIFEKQPVIVEPLVISLTSTPITQFNGDSTVTVTATGGVTPYTGIGTFIRKAGVYTFSVTDANGTIASSSVTITQPQDIIGTYNYQPISVYGGNTTLTITATGGISPYTYGKNDVYTSNNVFTNLTAGTYVFGIKDTTGYVVNKSIVLTEPPKPVSNFKIRGVTVRVSGGTQPYTYSFNGGGYTTNATNSNFKPGANIVIAKDANGNTSTMTVNL